MIHFKKYFILHLVTLVGTVAFLVLCKIADSAMGIS